MYIVLFHLDTTDHCPVASLNLRAYCLQQVALTVGESRETTVDTFADEQTATVAVDPGL
jgi:hypothetical protein